jgi:hypothetical protein
MQNPLDLFPFSFRIETLPFLLGACFILGFSIASSFRRWVLANPFVASHRLMGWPRKRLFKRFPSLLAVVMPLKYKSLAIAAFLIFLPLLPIMFLGGEYGWLWTAPGFVVVFALLLFANWMREEPELRVLVYTLARIGASRVARMAEPQMAETLLKKLLVEDDLKLSLIAVKYLGLVGSPTALATVNTIAQTKSNVLKTACQKAIALANADPETLPRFTAGELDQKMVIYKVNLRPTYPGSLPRASDFDKWMEELEDGIDQLLRTQKELKQEPKTAFCMGCNARAHFVSDGGWWWLQCNFCGQPTDLQTGIVQAIGVIGPVGDAHITDGEYRFEMWDYATKNILPSELDALEIASGGNFDYDWAVGEAVHWLEQSGRGLIPVRIHPEVNLQANSLRILDRVRQNG